VKPGIQRFQRVTKTLDTGFHRCDDFLREHQYLLIKLVAADLKTAAGMRAPSLFFAPVFR
jgi:hypothetical protein